MSMKAVNRRVEESIVDNEESSIDVPADDGVVMVMFPKNTWDRVQDMAKQTGKRSAEILMLALELLSNKMEDENGS